MQASWEAELNRLAPLPLLPEPFDLAVTRPVHKDCMVRFEQRSYAVPFVWVGQRVEVRGCAGKVQILAEGRVLLIPIGHTAERILIDPSCYEGEATDRVEAPRPLGKMPQRLQTIYEQPVEHRPLDLGHRRPARGTDPRRVRALAKRQPASPAGSAAPAFSLYCASVSTLSK